VSIPIAGVFNNDPVPGTYLELNFASGTVPNPSNLRRSEEYSPVAQPQWKVRQKSSGLFWNGNRWAALEGSYQENTATSLDEERELVSMTAIPPIDQALGFYQDVLDVIVHQHLVNALGGKEASTIIDLVGKKYHERSRGGGGIRAEIARVNVNVPPAPSPPPRPPPHPLWPKGIRHPNTGEEFVAGDIHQETGNQKLMSNGGVITVPVHGAGMTRGRFETASGAWVEGYVDGGAWVWTEMEVRKAKR
jgi:hypothetical protein